MPRVPIVLAVFFLAACHGIGGDLATLSRDDRPNRRQEAMLRLADRAARKSLRPDDRAQILASAVRHADDESALVRSTAAHCLGALGGEEAQRKLIAMAVSDKEPYVRADALVALSSFPSALFDSSLERAVHEDTAPIVKRTAVQLAASLADDAAASRILNLAVKAGDAGIAFQARKALDRRGLPVVEEPLPGVPGEPPPETPPEPPPEAPPETPPGEGAAAPPPARGE